MRVRIALTIIVPCINLLTARAVVALLLKRFKQFGQTIIFHKLTVRRSVAARTVAIQLAHIQGVAANHARNVLHDAFNHGHAFGTTETTERGVRMKIGAAHLAAQSGGGNKVRIVAVQQRALHDGRG